MPTYPVINKETGEKKTLSMTMKAYCEWKEENPGWDKDWSAGCAGVGEVGDMHLKGGQLKWMERNPRQSIQATWCKRP